MQRAIGGHTKYLGLDARRAPLDDARVRRALAHAIDRYALPQALGQTPAATGGLLPPAMPGHSARVAPAFDPDRARALLSDAGHPDGHGLGEIVLAHLKIQEEMASVIAAQLAAVGVPVRRLPADSVRRAGQPRSRSALTRTSGPWLRPPRSGRWLPPTTPPVGCALLPRRATRAAARPSGHRPRPGRAPAHMPRVRANLDRRASGRGAARLQRPPVVAAPMAHGHVDERDRRVDVRRGRPTAGTAFHAGTRLMRLKPAPHRPPSP